METLHRLQRHLKATLKSLPPSDTASAECRKYLSPSSAPARRVAMAAIHSLLEHGSIHARSPCCPRFPRFPGQKSPMPCRLLKRAFTCETAVVAERSAPATASYGPASYLFTACSLGFCSFHSHCDSFFQQSDHLSRAVSAVVPSLKHAASFPIPCGCKFSNLHFSDKMEILSPQETPAAHFPIPCGCEFSNLHFPDTMKSVSPQETPKSDPRLVPNWRQ